MPQFFQLEELVSLNPDTSYYKALKTKLVRAKNMCSDALEDATWFARYILEKTSS
jgi:hypothetical protein